MSLIDPEFLKNKQLIVQYLLEQRGSGHSLPYDDYLTINEWVKRAPTADHLLIILSDLIPRYYRQSIDKIGRPGSLNGIKKKVMTELKQLNVGQINNVHEQPMDQL